MKPASAYILRLQQAVTGKQVLTEADVIREIQQDAFHAGYAKASAELMGLALESEKRTDAMLSRAEAVGSRPLEH